jgi:hypothetical protein
MPSEDPLDVGEALGMELLAKLTPWMPKLTYEEKVELWFSVLLRIH